MEFLVRALKPDSKNQESSHRVQTFTIEALNEADARQQLAAHQKIQILSVQPKKRGFSGWGKSSGKDFSLLFFSQELLEELLRDYPGTVFLVSHDRMFLDNVITQSIVFEGEGRLKEYIGGYQDYIDAKSREEKTAAAPKPQTAAPEKAKPKANRTVKLSYKEQRELESLPDELAALEAEQADLNTQLSNPDIFKDYEKAALLQTRAEEIEMQLLEKLERWEMLENKQNSTG